MKKAKLNKYVQNRPIRRRKLLYWHDYIRTQYQLGLSARAIWASLVTLHGCKVQRASVIEYVNKWSGRGFPSSKELEEKEGLVGLEQDQLGQLPIVAPVVTVATHSPHTDSRTHQVGINKSIGFKVKGGIALESKEWGEDPLGSNWSGYRREKPWWEVLCGVRGGAKVVEELIHEKKYKKLLKVPMEHLEWGQFNLMDVFGAIRWRQHRAKADRSEMSEEYKMLDALYDGVMDRLVVEYKGRVTEARKVKFIISGKGDLEHVTGERRDYLELPLWWRRKMEVDGWVLPMEGAWEKEGGGSYQVGWVKEIGEGLGEGELVGELVEELPDWYKSRGIEDWVYGIRCREI